MNCFYYCTCVKDKNKKNKQNEGKTTFREVLVNDDEICCDCGYYALAYFDKVDPKRVKLYDKLYNSGIKEPSNRTKNGLSIKNNKENKKRSVKYENSTNTNDHN